MKRQDAVALVVEKLAEMGCAIQVVGNGRYIRVNANKDGVTAYNPAAKREVTGTASISVTFESKVLVNGSGSRGAVLADEAKAAIGEILIDESVEEVAVLKSAKKGEFFYGAKDEESF